MKTGPDRMRLGLLLIGFSWHTGSPRIGDKAHAARWALGLEDELPPAYHMLITGRLDDPTGIEELEELLDAEGH